MKEVKDSLGILSSEISCNRGNELDKKKIKEAVESETLKAKRKRSSKKKNIKILKQERDARRDNI